MTEPIRQTRSEQLRSFTVDDVNDTYRSGHITAGQKNDLLHEKARDSVAETLEKHGYMGAIWERSIKNLQDGWENLADAAKQDPTKGAGQNLWFIGQAMWGQIQMLTAPFTALGEVTGQVAENTALRAGAGPGLARVINIAVDVGTGFVPVGLAVRSGVRGVKGIMDAGKSKATAKALAVQEKAQEGVRKAAEAVAQGLALEDPKLAAALVREAEKQGIRGLAVPPSVEQAMGMAETAAGHVAHGGISRRDFLKTMGLAATVGPSALKGIIKGRGIVGASKETTKISELLFSSVEEGDMIVKMADGSLFHITGGRESVIGVIDRITGKITKTEPFSESSYPSLSQLYTEGWSGGVGEITSIPTRIMTRAEEIATFQLHGVTRPDAINEVNDIYKYNKAEAVSRRKALKEAVKSGNVSESSWMQRSLDDLEDTVTKLKPPVGKEARAAERGPKVKAVEDPKYKKLGDEYRAAEKEANDLRTRRDKGESVSETEIEAADSKSMGALNKMQNHTPASAVEGIHPDEFKKAFPEEAVTVVEQRTFKGNQVGEMGPGTKMLVAKDSAGNDVGFVKITPKSKNEFTVENIGIDTSKQRQGVGTSLMDEAETKYGKNVTSATADFTPEGKAFFASRGAGARPPVEPPSPPTPAAAPTPPPLSVRQQFQEDLKKFRRTMGGLTETQTHAQTKKLADELGLSIEDLKNVVPGSALDEKQMLAYLQALKPMTDKLIELSNIAKTGTEADAVAFMKHTSEVFTVAPIFRGSEITGGRSVDILKESPPMKQITDILTGWDPEKLAKGDWYGAVKTMAEDISDMADVSPEKVSALAIQAQTGWGRWKGEYWPMAREAFINLYLARPVTQVRNFAGGAVASSNALLERFVGSAFSADRANGLVGNDSLYLLKGMNAAIADGLKAFGQAYKSIDASDVSKLDFVPGAIPGVLGRIIRSPGDTMRGMDNLFKTILRRGSYYAEAYRDGIHQGMKGNDLADFVARRVNNPTHTMIKNGDDFALHNTFQNDLGRLGSRVREIGQVGPLVLWFPFMKTPINLAKYAWNRTPGLQLISTSLYQDIAAGGVKADLAIGRLTMSNLQAMFIYNLAQEGLITGSGPTDPKLRGVWMATHQPYSIRTKSGWMPITDFEPGNTPMGLVADFAQILNQLDEPSAGQAAMAISFALMKGMADKTYWRTLSDLVDVASGVVQGHDTGTRLRDVVLGPFMTSATGGPLVGGIVKMIDPIQRETRTYMDWLLSKTPNYSKILPPVRDWTGDPVLPPQAVGGPWVGLASPLRIKLDRPDRVKAEGDRLQIKVPKFPWSIGGTTRDDFDIRAPFPGDMIGVDLSAEQRDTWQQINKNMIRHQEFGVEKTLLDNPIYQKQTDPMKREMFMDAMADYRSTSREALTVKDAPLGKKLLENQAKRILPLLSADDQEIMKPQIEGAIGLFDGMAAQAKENLLRYGILPTEDDR